MQFGICCNSSNQVSTHSCHQLNGSLKKYKFFNESALYIIYVYNRSARIVEAHYKNSADCLNCNDIFLGMCHTHKCTHIHTQQIQANNTPAESIPNRPRFTTTVPSGVFLQPSRGIRTPPSKVRCDRTYSYFSVPKVFVQSLGGNHKANRITEIRPIVTNTTIGRLQKLR